MVKKCGVNLDIIDQDLDTLPMDQLEILMGRHTSHLQKRTAYKVLQRYFRNFESYNKGQQVNFDEDIHNRIQSQNNTIYNQDQQIIQLTQDNDELNLESQKLKRDIEGYKQQIAEGLLREDDLQSKISRAEKLNQSIGLELQQQKKEIRSLEEQLDEVNINMNKKIEELDRKKQEVIDLTQKMKNIQENSELNSNNCKKELESTKLALEKIKGLLE